MSQVWAYLNKVDIKHTMGKGTYHYIQIHKIQDVLLFKFLHVI